MKQRIGRISWAIYGFLWAWSVPLLAFDLVPPGGEFMASVMLVLPGALCGWWLIERYRWGGGIAASVILVGSWLTEHLGVTTGIPFGRYVYNGVLLPEIAGVVPLAIPFAWLLVVPAALEMARLMLGGQQYTAVMVPLAATWAVLFDMVIEPAAVYTYRYWTWLEQGGLFGIPTTNFVAWWALALVLAAATCRVVARQPHHLPNGISLPALLYCLNIGLFTLVNFTHQQYAAGGLGLGLLACIAWLSVRRGMRLNVRYDALA